MADTPEKSAMSFNIMMAIVIIVILIAGGVSWYFYSQYQHAQAVLKNPTSSVLEKDKALIAKVATLMVLPSEQPTIAEVSDKTKLQTQTFFAHAENGDKVLIYANAKKAVLYRPSVNKIIEVGPVNITAPSPTSAPQANAVSGTPSPGQISPTSTVSVGVAIYNGTSTVGLTSIAEKQLGDKKIGVNVILKDNAQKKPYDKTLVIDLTGKQKDMVANVAKVIGGTVGSMPSGETKPEPKDSDGKVSDILIILGKDFVK